MGQERKDCGDRKIELESLQFNIPASRPVLLANQDDLKDLLKQLARPAYESLYAKVLKLAVSDPGDVTSPQAAAADVDPLHFPIGWQLVGMERVLPAAGVAWQLTGERQYINEVIPILEAALECPHWSDGRHEVTDGYYDAAPETASAMRAFAWFLDLTWNDLPEDIKQPSIDRIAHLAQHLVDISKEGKVRWAADAFDDWSTTMHSAIGHVALLLLGTDDRAEGWLKHTISRINAYLECLPADGGHPSGIARWDLALLSCCVFLEALYRTTGVDIRRHPAIERTRQFAVRCLSPGATDIIQIDQGLPLIIHNVTNGPLSKLLVRWFQDPLLSWAMFSTPEPHYVGALDLLWYEDSVPQESPEELGLGSVEFPDIGWAIMRSGWGWDDNMVAFQCTPYWPGYHHLDQGAFQIFARGQELIVDSGLGWRAHPNYFNRYRDSLAHNVVLIDGKGQIKPSPECHGKMLEIELSEYADYVEGDCTGVYESAKSYIRSMLFLKPDVIVIRDLIELDRPRLVEWLLHGKGKFTAQLREGDRGFTLVSDEGTSLQSYVVHPQRWMYEHRRGYKLANWQTRHETTHPIFVVRTDRSAKVDIMMVFKLGDADQERQFPGVILDEDSILLHVNDVMWRITKSETGIDYCRDIEVF